jgi:hypothetical protein
MTMEPTTEYTNLTLAGAFRLLAAIDAARPDWVQQAACRGLDTALFYPESGASRKAAKAKEVCLECPVQAQCRKYAEEHRDHFGIWGGASPDERSGTVLRSTKVNTAHGTRSGYEYHRRNGETPCAACKAAVSRIVAARRARLKNK